jgi:hypothetical protein
MLVRDPELLGHDRFREAVQKAIVVVGLRVVVSTDGRDVPVGRIRVGVPEAMYITHLF